MATNFPTSLDAFTNPTAVDTLDSPPHDVQHADANDAIEALQAKVGVDGSAVTDSLDYKVAAIQQTLSGRNLVYNGSMQVAQRGTSVAGITGGGYRTADRWSSEVTSMGTWTQSLENDAPTGSGFRNSLKMLCTTADAAPSANDKVNILQGLEGQDLQRIKKGTSSAEQLTVSFWVKSNVTGTYVVEAYDLDNTRHVNATYTVVASGTWEKKTITLPADTTGAFDNDNAGSMLFFFWLGAGSTFTSGSLSTTWASASSANRAVGQTNVAAATNNYWQITGVQLETGPAATPFEHLPFGVELAKCQRYYQRVTSTAGDQTFCAGVFLNSNLAILSYNFPVMRSAPTMSFNGTYDVVTDAAALSATMTFANLTTSTAQLGGTCTGAVAGGGAIARQDSGYFDLSAEL